MNLQEIKTAVSAGKTVLYGNRAKVICDKHNQWMIVDQINKYAIGLTWEDGETMNGEESEFHIELEQQPTEKAVHDSYRSLSFVDVQAYADEHSLNIEGAENYREAAQALYAELYPPNPTAATIEFNGVKLTAEEFLDDPTYVLVNRVELESELADAEMHRIYSPAQYQKLTQPAEDGNGTTWTEEGQEIYNDLIDYFSGIIMKCSAPTGLNEDLGNDNSEEAKESNEILLQEDIALMAYCAGHQNLYLKDGIISTYHVCIAIAKKFNALHAGKNWSDESICWDEQAESFFNAEIETYKQIEAEDSEIKHPGKFFDEELQEDVLVKKLYEQEYPEGPNSKVRRYSYSIQKSFDRESNAFWELTIGDDMENNQLKTYTYYNEDKAKEDGDLLAEILDINEG